MKVWNPFVRVRGLTNPCFLMYPLQKVSVKRVVDSTLDIHMLLMGYYSYVIA